MSQRRKLQEAVAAASDRQLLLALGECQRIADSAQRAGILDATRLWLALRDVLLAAAPPAARGLESDGEVAV